MSVERETFPGLLASGATVIGFVDTTYWRDIGKPADLVAGSADLVRGLAPSAAVPGPVGESLVLPGASVAADAVLCGGATVGAGCVVGPGVTLDGAVLFDGASVGDGSVVRRSVVGRDAVVAAGVRLEDAVIGDRARLGSGVELLGGARVWPDVELPGGSVRFSSDA